MYVGVTRAQRSLQISWCRTRRRGSGRKAAGVEREPSRFIAEMDLAAATPPVTTGQGAGRERLAGLKALLQGR